MREICVAYMPGPRTELLSELVPDLLAAFTRLGHEVKEIPDEDTDILLTTARFGEPLEWREAPIFNVRRRYGLRHQPTIYTLVHMRRDEFASEIRRLDAALEREPIDPSDFDLPGLAPTAVRVLAEQGRRGGPILSLQRVLQAQSKSIRVLLIVGDDQPEDIFHFDLVGAYPRSQGSNLREIYEDTVRRIATTVSTREVTAHEVVGEPISKGLWQELSTPAAMRTAGRELGRRGFFTEMVKIADLVQVPAVTEGVASQYSEGCFATWEPRLDALIATVTGSARPVDKGDITDDDLSVIAGVRADGSGAQVYQIEGGRNDPPSSEAVEMMDMDLLLPQVDFEGARVPVVRSKLHGHRSIGAYDPRHVEFLPLDEPYYYYLVSCATAAQAQGIKGAFARSQAMRDPDDARTVAFTVLPGHGCFIAEKWVKGKAPFETIWELMDAGFLEIESAIPQGPMSYREANGKMKLGSEQSDVLIVRG
jgi:hypothetical protein